MALATQLQLERFMQVAFGVDPEPVVTLLLENASGVVESHIDRRLELTTYTNEIYDAPPGQTLRLKQRPINQTIGPVVVAVTEEGTALTIADDFIVYERAGMLKRVNGSTQPRHWLHNQLQGISVTYQAGYVFTTDPVIEPEPLVARDVVLRIAQRVCIAAFDWANLPAGSEGIKSISLKGSDSVTFIDSLSSIVNQGIQLTEADKFTLSRLKRRSFK